MTERLLFSAIPAWTLHRCHDFCPKKPAALDADRSRSDELDLAAGLEFEARTFAAIAHTHDLAEGTRAFLEKRKANFTGN